MAALSAAGAFGAAAVLQGIATRDTTAVGGLDPGLLLHLLRRPLFLGAVVLNLVGFGLHIAALQSLPLFLVQAVISSSVAVTALLSVRVFGTPLNGRQGASIVAVFAGLTMLAVTAHGGEAPAVGLWASAALLAVVVVSAGLSASAARLAPGTAALLIGLLSGVCFGVVAVAARLLPDLSPLVVLRAPQAYVLAVAGLVAFFLYATAMQRASVTTTTAAVVVTQTAVPALIGVVLLGDEVRSGLVPLAVAGFALALLGALGLARFEASPLAPTEAPGPLRP